MAIYRCVDCKYQIIGHPLTKRCPKCKQERAKKYAKIRKYKQQKIYRGPKAHNNISPQEKMDAYIDVYENKTPIEVAVRKVYQNITLDGERVFINIPQSLKSIFYGWKKDIENEFKIKINRKNLTGKPKTKPRPKPTRFMDIKIGEKFKKVSKFVRISLSFNDYNAVELSTGKLYTFYSMEKVKKI